MEKYISVTYKEKDKPRTNYPEKLIHHLFRGKKKLFHSRLYDKVLDLGSGRGEYLVAFWSNQFKVEGFDRCPPAEDLQSFPVTLGDLEKPLPYKNNTFDIVFCKSVIEHLYYPEKLFKEVNRVLRPGGYFVVIVPDWYSTREIFYQDFTHRSPFTINSLGAILAVHDFKNVKSKLFTQLPIIWKFPWLIPICKLASLFYKTDTKNKFIKFSKEKMILGVGIK